MKSSVLLCASVFLCSAAAAESIDDYRCNTATGAFSHSSSGRPLPVSLLRKEIRRLPAIKNALRRKRAAATLRRIVDSVTDCRNAASQFQRVANGRIDSGAAVVYFMDEGSGNTLLDSAPTTPALPLSFNPVKVSRLAAEPGIVVHTVDGLALSAAPATKVIQTIQNSRRFSLEFWTTPSTITSTATEQLLALTSGTQSSQTNLILAKQGAKLTLTLRRLVAGRNRLVSTSLGNVINQPTTPHHIVLTYDGLGLRVFVDGSLRGESSLVDASFAPWNLQSLLRVGNGAALRNPLLGKLHLLAVFPRALSPNEVIANYAAGYTAPASSSSLSSVASSVITSSPSSSSGSQISSLASSTSSSSSSTPASSQASSQSSSATSSGSGVQYYLDAVNGFDDYRGDGTASKPWKSVARVLTVVSSGDTVLLHPGTYGAFEDVAAESFGRTDYITWKAANIAQKPRFDSINVSCNDCNAFLRFENIEVRFPAGPWLNQGTSVVNLTGASNVEILSSKLSSEQLYRAGAAIYAGGRVHPLRHLIVDATEITNVIVGARFFNAEDVVFSQNTIHHFAGTAIGAGYNTSPELGYNSARNVTISGNYIYDQGEFPAEDFYTPYYDDPEELHASIIAIRGPNFSIVDNHVHNIRNSVGIQTYQDANNPNLYDLRDIVIERNLFYDMASILQVNGNLRGPIIVRGNTFISSAQNPNYAALTNPCNRFINPLLSPFEHQIFYIPFNTAVYNGSGSVIENNLFMLEFSVSPATYATVERNIIYTRLFESGTYSPTNKVICDEITRGTLTANFIDQQLFRAPNFQGRFHQLTCAPGETCDFSPVLGSIACDFSTTGNHVGALPCR